MGRSVYVCGVDTSALPKIGAKESNELLKRIKNGDDEARNRFINCNLRLVLSVVNRYSARCGDADDLFQMGCIGLIKSIDNFNVDLGVRFSTYAVPMIAGEIRRYLRESNSLRISRSIRDVAYLAISTRERLESEGGGEVSVEQVAQELNMPICNVMYCLDAISDPISLSENVYGDEEDNLTLQDCIRDGKESENKWTDNVALTDAINELDEKERNILFKRYYLDKTQNEISEEIGLSQAQVSRIEKNAINRIKDYFAD